MGKVQKVGQMVQNTLVHISSERRKAKEILNGLIMLLMKESLRIII